jgi:hypothetical protein
MTAKGIPHRLAPALRTLLTGAVGTTQASQVAGATFLGPSDGVSLLRRKHPIPGALLTMPALSFQRTAKAAGLLVSSESSGSVRDPSRLLKKSHEMNNDGRGSV